jgi:UDP-galactopyranose mutase
MDLLRDYFGQEGIFLNGRFGEFEYLNMDSVIDHSMRLSERL